MEVSLYTLWLDAGWFARGIIILLLFMSIISLGTGAQKWWRFRKARRSTANFAPEFARFLQEEQLDQAIELAEATSESHVARVLGEALAEVKPLLRDRATITSADINSAERAIERQMLIILSELKRGLGVLATTGATAPFVGLLVLGAVVGSLAWEILERLLVLADVTLDLSVGPVGFDLRVLAVTVRANPGTLLGCLGSVALFRNASRA